MLIEEYFQKELSKRTAAGNYRRLCYNENLIDFCSNDYLGFSRSRLLHDQLMHEWQCAYTAFKRLGSTGSRLLTGHIPYVEELETSIAKFHKAESALIFNSGYMANSGLLQTLLTRDSTVIYDLHVHASMQEGIRRSRAKPLPFYHQNLDHLERKLQKAKKPIFVCVESIYSLDGRTTSLSEMCELCEKYGANLIVDEAHSTGILGERGEGLVCHLELENRVFARIHTFGKALGVHGAAVVGSANLCQYLINFCPAFIYTTSLPLPAWAAIKCAYNLLPVAKQERIQLKILQDSLSAKLKSLNTASINSPIIPIRIKGGNAAAKAISEKLKLHGFDLRPILSPTVQRGRECLRLCLHAFNSIQELDALCGILTTFEI